MTDVIAERGRKIGGNTLRSIGDSSRRQRLRDNDEETLTPQKMLSELREDNSLLTGYMRETHEICAKHNDIATTSLIMESMAHLVPDAASYAPVTVLIDQRPDGVHLSYDEMASLLAQYGNPEAVEIARDLDVKVRRLLQEAS